jgi:hypothetical protein
MNGSSNEVTKNVIPFLPFMHVADQIKYDRQIARSSDSIGSPDCVRKINKYFRVDLSDCPLYL